MLLPLNLWESAVTAEDRTENKAAHNTSNSRKSNWDKHANRDAVRSQKKNEGNDNWVDQGRHTNSQRNKKRNR